MAIETLIDAAEAWAIIRKNALQIKLGIVGMKATLQGGNVSVEQIFNGVYRPLINSKNQLDSLAATANLNAYVQDVTGNALYDAVSEIADTSAAIQACLDWINSNANGLALTGDTADNYITTGSVATNRFTTGNTSGLRSLLDGVTASINS